MPAVELTLAGVAVIGASWLVLRDLRPPPPKRTVVRAPRVVAAPVVRPPVEPAPVTVTPPVAVTLPVEPAPLAPRQTSPPAAAGSPTATTTSMLEQLATVEQDVGSPMWRRVSSAMALLVMTLAVAGAMGAAIYQGLLALKP